MVFKGFQTLSIPFGFSFIIDCEIMKATAKASKRVTDIDSKIKSAYREFVLTNGQNPTSVFLFCKTLNIEETAFYEHYNSFDAVAADIWKSLIADTVVKVKAEEVYAGYNTREKFLAFLYTYFEVLKSERSYVTATFDAKKAFTGRTHILEAAKTAFIDYAKDLLLEGIETREVKSRTFISDRYPDLMWFKLLFLTDFWIRDTSKGFENTDAAVEKSVNLIFELMGQNTLDYIVDFAKFMFATKS
jgi:AcrR family transcriptional regulator